MAKKKNHLSEVLNAITQKSPCDYDKKEVSAFVISMFLSEDQKLCEIVNRINPYIFSLTDEAIFKYYVRTVPAGRYNLKWTKGSKANKARSEKVSELSERYGISRREAEESL